MDTIKQKTQTVEFESGRRVKVQRMRWKAARSFLKKLGDSATKLLKGVDIQKDATTAQVIAVFLPKVQELIVTADDLIITLLTESTVLTAEEIDALDSMEASALVKAAVEVNFDRELKNCWSGVLNVLADLMGFERTTPTDESTPSSSEQDSPPTTSTAAVTQTSTSI